MKNSAANVDRTVPVLIVKIGPYPLHHGGLAVIRTLGRLGVPVYAITEDRFTPAALSRHLFGRFDWPTTGHEDPDLLVAGLVDIGRRMGRPFVALPTDDEAAILVAEHGAELGEHFLFPGVRRGLPRVLADKHGLAHLCRAHGIPTPATELPVSIDDLFAAADRIGYPLVVKNARPWTRLNEPAVGSSTVVHEDRDLHSLVGDRSAMPNVLLQEYVPADAGSDWVVNVYCDDDSATPVRFTGLKVRCWPAQAGVGSLLYAAPNDGIAELTTDFCRKVGYKGIADLDWRLDRRTGQFQLLDFNPRMGAQAQLFRTDAGVDVVSALHLDLTGRQVPAGTQVYGHGLRVEHLDVPAAVAYWRSGQRRPVPMPWGRTRLAWLTPDDPLPAVSAAFHSARPAASMLGRMVRRSKPHPQGAAGRAGGWGTNS